MASTSWSRIILPPHDLELSSAKLNHAKAATVNKGNVIVVLYGAVPFLQNSINTELQKKKNTQT